MTLPHFIRDLADRYRAYHEHDPRLIRYAALVGMVSFPLFYLIRYSGLPLPPIYDDLWLRLIAVGLCLGMLTVTRWPETLQRWRFAYSYGLLLFCFPFFFVFTALHNQGGLVSVVNSLMAVFFVVLLTDWRNTLAMLLLGAVLASGLYMVTSPSPKLPLSYFVWIPTFLLVVLGGSLFKFGEKQSELEKMRRTYTGLAGSIAHEMRNPLTQLMAGVVSIQRHLPPPAAEAQDHILPAADIEALYAELGHCQNAINRGLQVIDMTLDQVKNIDFDTKQFEFLAADDLAQRAVSAFGFDDPGHRERVSVEVEHPFTFKGPETAVLYVLFNLLKNAVYYFEQCPRSQITVRVSAPEIVVRDTGPGIPEHVIPRLFAAFETLGKAGGTGLGLAYCRRVMRALGGDIDCRSELGVFTEFRMQFPCVSEAEVAADSAQAIQAAREVMQGKRVLVVDDSQILRKLARAKLLQLGCKVDEAEDGVQSLKVMATTTYDLVLMDLRMPNLDGYAASERIRSGIVAGQEDVPIVAHSSEAPATAIVKTRRAGINAFLPKGCGDAEFARTLRQQVEQHRARPKETLEGLTVLVTDDSSMSRKLARLYLQQVGVDVLEASDGQTALNTLRDNSQIRAVFVDMNMPGMGGLDVARALRASDWSTRSIPIFTLTADSSESIMEEARAAGVNDFIVKPAESDTLLSALARHLHLTVSLPSRM